MTTIITAQGNSIDSKFDLRFGRAKWFCKIEGNSGKIEFIENPYTEEKQGAAEKVIALLKETGVKKVISGDFGDKAFGSLEESNIQMVIMSDFRGKISDILKLMHIK